MIFPLLRLGDKHKFVRQLKKYLNELVQPSPNLPDNEVVDNQTLKAVYAFKNQWMKRISYSDYEKNHLYEISPGLWAMIGRALGKDRLLSDLREIKENEIRSLLLGMEANNNIASSYTLEMEKCDAKIASILGSKNAVAAANGFEPDSLAILSADKSGYYKYYRGDTIENGQPTVGHLSVYMMHLYGSTDGTRFGVDGKTETDIYIPDGFEMKSNADWDGKAKKNVLKQIPTPKQAIVTFHYKQLGNVKDATLLLMHVKAFNPLKEGNRWRIGKIGGKGGEIINANQPYLHSHFMLLKGDVGLGYKGSNTVAIDKYRATIGIRFADAFC